MIKVLSLGAGVQSTTVLRLAIHGEIERPDHVIFADTGWEPRSVYEHFEILKLEMDAAKITFTMVSSGNILNDTLRVAQDGIRKGSTAPSLPFFTVDDDGSKAMQMRQCTRGYKIDPMRKFVRKMAGVGRKTKSSIPVVEWWFGISTDEIRRTRISPDWWATYYYPLVELGMTRSDCIRWNSDHGFPAPPRSACIGCPYKSDEEWRHLANTSPDEFEEACVFDEKIRIRAGVRGQSFVHRSFTPLREVDLRSLEDHGQQNMWRDLECAGMCGV